MAQRNTLQVLGEIIARHVPEAASPFRISRELRLADLGIDSARHVDIILDTEDQFHISIDESRVRTVGDLVEMIDCLAAAA